MCGISFSGKSTLAQKIATKIGAPVISLDEINHGRGLGLNGDAIPDEEWVKTHGMALEKLEEAMVSERDIVLDDTNCFRWLRDSFTRIVRRTKGLRQLLYI